MNYQIQSKTDLSLGITLTVRIPESELDRKALYTILADTPKFLLPFRYKNVDGYIEFTYIVGVKNKLQYSYGNRNPQEYAALWSNILNPLLECDDWFMNPFSFVLQTDYLYLDKSNGTISYVYVPSMRECSDTGELKNMAVELAQKCPSNNSDLEIKALRAIMQDFNPQQFLQMLKPYQTPDAASIKTAPKNSDELHVPNPPPAPLMPLNNGNVRPSQDRPVADNSGAPDDIIIDLHGGKTDKKKQPDKGKPKGGGLFAAKSDKKSGIGQAGEQPKVKGGLFGKKKTEPQPMIMGAAAQQHNTPIKKPGIVNETRANIEITDGITQLDEDSVTQLESETAKLRLVSNAPLPKEIIIDCIPGKVFVIGRFDISVGRQQADFEFDKSTKSVSRRHAAVERSAQGYAIIDLSSSAGTFVNGQKLIPNVPHELTFGTRVSFGTSGADYVWER